MARGPRRRINRNGAASRPSRVPTTPNPHGPPRARRYTPAVIPHVADLGRRAKTASRRLLTATTREREAALTAAADLVLERGPEILHANAADVDAAAAAGLDATPLDRLRLDEGRLAGMAGGLRQVAALPDPLGEVIDGWRRPNGLELRRVRVPLGVVAIIYENRPNVTSDAAGICVKSGNAVLLRGSSSALRTNRAIVDVLRDAMTKAGLPADAVLLVDDTSHDGAVALMQLTDSVDCLIPGAAPTSSPASASTPPSPPSSTATATVTSTSTPPPTSTWRSASS